MSAQTTPSTKTYLALGDSYTIGEAVEENERWPVVLVDMLNKNGQQFAAPKIVATTGWTSDELISGIEVAGLKGQKFDMVSLLIGVNNQYRGYHIEIYKNELSELVFTAMRFANGDPNRVFMVSIPDYGVTPFTEKNGLDAEKIAKELDKYNQVARELAKENGIRFFDITPISKQAKEDPSLVASDGLHPSAAMYASWTKLIYEGL